MQKGQPIAFAARALTAVEQNYAVIEKECLAICFACDKFHQYLMCHDNIKVESDHKPLEIIFSKKHSGCTEAPPTEAITATKIPAVGVSQGKVSNADFLSRIKLSSNHSQVVEQHQSRRGVHFG